MDIINELEQKRDSLVTSFFWLAFNTIFIFGIPAVLAVFVGKRLNIFFETRGIQLVLLFLAFVGSWMITIYAYRKKLAVLRSMDDQIKAVRVAAGIVPPVTSPNS